MAKSYNYYYFTFAGGGIWSPGTSLAEARAKIFPHFPGAKFHHVDISTKAPCPHCGGTVRHKPDCELLAIQEECVK